MPERDTTYDANDRTAPSESSGEQGTPVETPCLANETFVAGRPGDFEIVLPRSTIEKAMEKLMETTGSPDFHDAMELVWFKSDPERDRDVRENASMLLTLYRCARDGNVKPPVDLEALYAEKYREMAAERPFAPGSG